MSLRQQNRHSDESTRHRSDLSRRLPIVAVQPQRRERPVASARPHPLLHVQQGGRSGGRHSQPIENDPAADRRCADLRTIRSTSGTEERHDVRGDHSLRQQEAIHGNLIEGRGRAQRRRTFDEEIQTGYVGLENSTVVFLSFFLSTAEEM